MIPSSVPVFTSSHDPSTAVGPAEPSGMLKTQITGEGAGCEWEMRREISHIRKPTLSQERSGRKSRLAPFEMTGARGPLCRSSFGSAQDRFRSDPQTRRGGERNADRPHSGNESRRQELRSALDVWG
jgi:hypothetical protein